MLQASYDDVTFTHQNQSQRVLFVIPVFNDWASLTTLLEHLDLTLARQGIDAEVLAVDDASSTTAKDALHLMHLTAIERVNVLKLKRNLGHQRAITIGLAYAEANCSTDILVVMDSDGEDTPEDVIRLIHACAAAKYQKIVFARRSQRSESWLFKLFYRAYRSTYRLLTGFDIRVGNFSVIPFELLCRLVVISEIWNHYAAGILKSKLPNFDIPTRRGHRYHGQSKMNFTALVTHGLSAISVYGEMVGARLLIVSFGLIGFTIVVLLTVIGIRLMTNFAIPGWTSYLVVALVSVILLAFIISLSFMFLVLIGRNQTSFLPNRDYHHFVLTLEEAFLTMKSYSYIGSELELFREAKNWKDYYYRMIRRYLGAEVLEVGAGIGGTTKLLCRQRHDRWVCLEPDPGLVDVLKAESDLPAVCEIRQGLLAELPQGERFDAILYIDVLEHIEDDQAEIHRATTHLKPGGFLIVLAPAHQWLFSPFDHSIGHYRRYNRFMLRNLTPPGLTSVSLKYLDSVGLLASLSNRWLKQRMPTPGQIQLWDTWMVPVSKVIDPMLQYALGKSVLGVWQKERKDTSVIEYFDNL